MMIILLSATGEQAFFPDWNQKQTPDSMNPLQSLPISAPRGSFAAPYDSLDSSSSPLISSWKIPICAKLHTVATSNFSLVNLLGEGTLVFVYREDIPHGQILAVKSTVALSITEEEQSMASADSGYYVPEHVKQRSGYPKADISSFAIEILTEGQPFDSSKPKGEQSLVEWTSSKLHDSESLLEMADPTIRRNSTGVPSSSEGTISQDAKTDKEEDKEEEKEESHKTLDEDCQQTEQGEKDRDDGEEEEEKKEEQEEEQEEEEQEEEQEEEEEEEEIQEEEKEEQQQSLQIEVDTNAGAAGREEEGEEQQQQPLQIEVDTNAGAAGREEEGEEEQQQPLQIEVDNNADDAGRGEEAEEEQQPPLQIEVDNNADDAGRGESILDWICNNLPMITFAALGIYFLGGTINYFTQMYLGKGISFPE